MCCCSCHPLIPPVSSHPINMFSGQSSEISLDKPCRAVAALTDSSTDGVTTTASSFLVGSCSCLAEDTNELSLLRYQPHHTNELNLEMKIPVPGAVKSLASCPIDSRLLLMTQEGSNSIGLYNLPLLRATTDDDDLSVQSSSVQNSSIETLAVFDCDDQVVDMVWRDDRVDSQDDYYGSAGAIGQSANVVSVEKSGCVRLWGVGIERHMAPVHQFPNSSSQFGGTSSPSTTMWPSRVAWDPHNRSTVAVTRGSKVDLLDWRAEATASSLPVDTVSSFKAHRHGVTDIDYNPNKPFVMATSGQEGTIKFWDLRHAKQPILVARGGHSHWVTSVRYNPFHDQLVLTTGTDSVSNLWRLSSISSAPLLTLEDENDTEESIGDLRVQKHEHTEAVYSSCWSSTDAWVYLTLGYDGKAILNHVPSKEKYKILL